MTAGIGSYWNDINSTLASYPPLAIAAASAIAALAIKKLSESARPASIRKKAGSWLLSIPSIRKEYDRKIEKHLLEFQHKTKEKWAQFGPLCLKIPEEGKSKEQLVELIGRYTKLTEEPLHGKHFSGTIYSPKFIGEESPVKPAPPTLHSEGKSFREFAQKLEELYTLAFQKAYLWNSLHADEFPAGGAIEYQVVQMAAESFGGDGSLAMGFVSSGGTESIMSAARAYRNWGREKGHAANQSVIIAPDSVHASLIKAATDYDFRLVLIPTDPSGKADLNALRSELKKHGSNVVAIVGSAPSYPKGAIDPIEEMASLAKHHGCGMHVDCCLGGFIINFQDPEKGRLLSLPGVTSLSMDTHKNGWAPKGSSILIGQPLPNGKNLAFYSIYAIPGWSGGVYGTPRSPGSQSCLPAFHAFLAMMAIGKEGYRKIAADIVEKTIALGKIVERCPGLKLLVKPEVNVVAFSVDPDLGLAEGASYVFAKEMKQRGFVLNTLRGDSVHFCVTGRFLEDPQALDRFERSAKSSLEAVKKLDAELKRKGEKFSGEASIYCTLEAAIQPNLQKQGWGKYLENQLFGKKGAEDSVKTYFLAQMNPEYIQMNSRVGR